MFAELVCLLEGVWSVDTLMRARDLPVLVEDTLAVDTLVQALDWTVGDEGTLEVDEAAVQSQGRRACTLIRPD